MPICRVAISLFVFRASPAHGHPVSHCMPEQKECKHLKCKYMRNAKLSNQIRRTSSCSLKTDPIYCITRIFLPRRLSSAVYNGKEKYTFVTKAFRFWNRSHFSLGRAYVHLVFSPSLLQHQYHGLFCSFPLQSKV